MASSAKRTRQTLTQAQKIANRNKSIALREKLEEVVGEYNADARKIAADEHR